MLSQNEPVRTEENHQRRQVELLVLPAEIRTGHLSNRSYKRYFLSQLAW
jgi:hypothetical protein